MQTLAQFVWLINTLEAKTGKKVVSKANYLATAPAPGLLDAPQPAPPSQPKARVKSKVSKGE